MKHGFGAAWQKYNMSDDLKSMTFQDELVLLINKHSLERHSNTPDFILAEFMASCLHLFNKTTIEREEWHLGVQSNNEN